MAFDISKVSVDDKIYNIKDEYARENMLTTSALETVLNAYGVITKEELQNLKKSVSDGKTLVADAITDKGVQTAADAEFAIMANNISNIAGGEGISTNDANAVAGDILQGKTAYVKDKKVTGTIPTVSAENGSLEATTAAVDNGRIYLPIDGKGKYFDNIESVHKQEPQLKSEFILRDASIAGVQGEVIPLFGDNVQYYYNNNSVTIPIKDTTCLLMARQGSFAYFILYFPALDISFIRDTTSTTTSKLRCNIEKSPRTFWNYSMAKDEKNITFSKTSN